MRCSIDPVCAGTEIHPVQIDFEELILREAALKPKGQQGLSDLASQAAFRTQEKNLRELLGDRAAALHNMPSAKVRNRGTQQTDGIDAEMAVEAAVLGRDDGLGQIGRHLLQSQRFTKQVSEIGQRAAVFGEDRDRGTALREPELGRVWQGQRKIAEGTAAEDRSPKEDENREPQQDGREAGSAPRKPRSAALPRRPASAPCAR